MKAMQAIIKVDITAANAPGINGTSSQLCASLFSMTVSVASFISCSVKAVFAVMDIAHGENGSYPARYTRHAWRICSCQADQHLRYSSLAARLINEAGMCLEQSP